MKHTRLSLLFFLGLLCSHASGQVPTDIGGIINFYTPVTGINACAATLEVTSPQSFEAGSRAVLIQMQGATINTTNTASFGDITDLGQAGLYEIVSIQSVAGNTLSLAFAPLHAYDLNGRVQLVSFPELEAAAVVLPLRAQPWNGQTGGVLALSVEGQLTLNDEIDVSGQGFRGGLSQAGPGNNCNFLIPANAYSYALGNWRGVPKGEGVAIALPSMASGRGAQANGGGGGNDHNAGGGGGAHLSSGGPGGQNAEPATFGCDGLFPGRGGKALPTAAADGRLFMGGGGGAGHENNSVGTDGGNGGGIALLMVGSLVANGHAIRANGLTPPNGFGDGAGGGGAGGSVVLLAASATEHSIMANGGHGGQVSNGNEARCFGPGGGGSGGRILSNLALAPSQNATTNGGAAGLSVNSTACAVGSNGAQAGTAGSTVLFSALPASTLLSSVPVIVDQPMALAFCPGEALVLGVAVAGSGLAFQWQLDSGSGFGNITPSAAYTGTQTDTLTLNAPLPPGALFRLRISSPCAGEVFSEAIAVTVLPLPQAAFTAAQTGASTVQFMSTALPGQTLLWDFGDGNTATSENPAHTYAAPGQYTVTLTVANACGADIASQALIVGAAPTAAFSAAPLTGCAPRQVQFVSQASGDVNSVQWWFPGGVPGMSSQEAPLVAYMAPGQYDVTLIAIGAFGADTLRRLALIDVLPSPVPGFSFEADGLTVAFTDESVGASTLVWNFGDGQSSNMANPVHTYAVPGVYEVTLNAQNGACGLSFSRTIFLSVTALSREAGGLAARIFPNPVSGVLHIDLGSSEQGSGGAWHYWLYDAQGRSVRTGTARGAYHAVEMEDLPAGLYWLRLTVADGRQWLGRAVKR